MASAEDIDLGMTTTFGFRMFCEGSFKHNDLAGTWRWPYDIRARTVEKNIAEQGPDLSAEAAGTIREHCLSGQPWFIDPEKFDEEQAKGDRAYVRRLKELHWRQLYWSKQPPQ